MIRIITAFILFTLTPVQTFSFSKEMVTHLVSERLGKLERFVFLFSVTSPSSPESKYNEMKKLILQGRDTLNVTEKGDHTLRVQEELYWYGNSNHPKDEPAHSLGFTDGKHSYLWQRVGDGISANQSDQPSYLHTQVPPSIYLFVESVMLYPIVNLLEQMDENRNAPSPNIFAKQNDLLTIEIPILAGQIHAEIQFDIHKGLKRSIMKNGPGGNFIVDEFQQIKEDIWVPKYARLVHADENGIRDTKIEVLKVLVNDDVDPATFQKANWDDPKYSSETILSPKKGNYIEQIKTHPPSYIESFFDIPPEEALRIFRKIEMPK